MRLVGPWTRGRRAPRRGAGAARARAQARIRLHDRSRRRVDQSD